MSKKEALHLILFWEPIKEDGNEEEFRLANHGDYTARRQLSDDSAGTCQQYRCLTEPPSTSLRVRVVHECLRVIVPPCAWAGRKPKAHGGDATAAAERWPAHRDRRPGLRRAREEWHDPPH